MAWSPKLGIPSPMMDYLTRNNRKKANNSVGRGTVKTKGQEEETTKRGKTKAIECMHYLTSDRVEEIEHKGVFPTQVSSEI